MLIWLATAGHRRYSISPLFNELFEGDDDSDGSKVELPPHPNVIIITAIPADPCQFPTADLINKLSVVNKQDYAHMHGFELHLSADIIDPNVTAVRFPLPPPL